MNNFLELYYSVLFGLIFGIIFGTIDAIFFVLLEKNLTHYLKESIHNRIIINLSEGALSACISLLIANYIESSIAHKTINIMKHPLLDCFGIIIGATIVGIFYILYVRNFNNNEIKNS
jgi:uncharacterized protein YacL